MQIKNRSSTFRLLFLSPVTVMKLTFMTAIFLRVSVSNTPCHIMVHNKSHKKLTLTNIRKKLMTYEKGIAGILRCEVCFVLDFISTFHFALRNKN